MPSRRLSPDRALEIQLSAVARRLSRDHERLEDDLVDELRGIASGRGDLLAEAAGQALGGYLAHPGSSHPADVRAAALLVLAGADPDRIVAHVDRAREAAGRFHGTHTTGGPPNGAPGQAR